MSYGLGNCDGCGAAILPGGRVNHLSDDCAAMTPKTATPGCARCGAALAGHGAQGADALGLSRQSISQIL